MKNGRPVSVIRKECVQPMQMALRNRNLSAWVVFFCSNACSRRCKSKVASLRGLQKNLPSCG